jgi:hypothetical protein
MTYISPHVLFPLDCSSSPTAKAARLAVRTSTLVKLLLVSCRLDIELTANYIFGTQTYLLEYLPCFRIR